MLLIAIITPALYPMQNKTNNMTESWMISISLLVVYAALIVMVSLNHHKKQDSKKTWKIWILSIGYWEGVFFVSCLLTMLTIFILKWTELLTF